jgi:hypothetical protein
METVSMLHKSHFPDVPPADRAAIVDALYRFGAGQDLRDRPLLESAFAEDASLDFTAAAAKLGATIPVFQGRQAIAETIMAATEPLDTTHTITNVRVTAHDGSRATVTALIEAQHLPRGDHSRHLLLKNRLSVELVREEEYWVIQHMRFDNAWRTGDPTVLFAEG